MMKLTRDNYHSKEADMEYFSVSQIKSMIDCEAAALAELRGEFVSEEKKTFTAGRMLHAWSEGREAYDEFCDRNRSILFKKDGSLYADYVTVTEMIDCLRQSSFAMFFLQGDKEEIVVADLFGYPVKIRIDVVNRLRKTIVDLKSCKDIREKIWNPSSRSYVSWVEYYGYPLQFAVYNEVDRIAKGRPERDWCESFIVAVSKQSPCDKEVINMTDPDRWQSELDMVKLLLPRFDDVKRGLVAPDRCEECAYCRATKVLERAIDYRELG